MAGEMNFALSWLYAPSDGAFAPIAAIPHPKVKDPPSPEPPAPMPDLYDPALLARKRGPLDSASVRSGRISTMLSAENAYGSDKLGLR